VALALAVVSLYSLRVRPDAFHAAPLLVALGVALLVVLPRMVRWVRAVALVAVVAAVAVGLAATSFSSVGSGVDGVARMAGVQSDEPAGLAQTLARLRTQVEPGDPLFVANTDNSVTFLNAAFVYWALAADPATPLVEFDPGYADQDDVQADVVQDLCRVQPTVVLWDAPVSGSLDGLRFSDVLDGFLADDYRVTSTDGDFRVLSPRPDLSC